MQAVLVLGTIKSVSNSTYCTGGGSGNIYTKKMICHLITLALYFVLLRARVAGRCGGGGVGNLIHVCCEVGFSTKGLALGVTCGGIWASEFLPRASLLVPEMAVPDKTTKVLKWNITSINHSIYAASWHSAAIVTEFVLSHRFQFNHRIFSWITLVYLPSFAYT